MTDDHTPPEEHESTEVRPGQLLSHYRLVEKIGEGGMGVVWCGRDTKLDRHVAIKILPRPFSQNVERLARFEREARLLASLNHANIATIHGLEQSESVHFLAMELVEGEELAARIGRGAVPIEEALPLARQIADALEAAHEKGVIHRDLKPQNIRVTPEGKIKVLDFGLAKAFGPHSTDMMPRPSMSPTITSAGNTAAGVILGTAAYMSPEQAKGQAVDRRADIWAFGVVLHEMLTGRSLYQKKSVPETLAAVMMSEPDLTTLPASTPPRVRRLIERCLRKDPQSRLRDAGDARIVIEEAVAGQEWKHVATGDAVVRPTRLSPRTILFPGLPLLVLGLLIGVFLLGGLVSREPRSHRGPVHMTIVPEQEPSEFFIPFISPDGSRVAYTAEDGIRVRELARPDERLLPGTEGVSWGRTEFSPDGRWIAFVRDGRLFKVPADGSALPLELGEWKRGALWYLWLESGKIINASAGAPIYGIDATDGTALAEVKVTGFTGTNALALLHTLPGDPRYVLGVADSFDEDGTWHTNTVLVDTETGESSLLVEDAGFAAWSPSGHLVFSRDNDLLAAPFDLEHREISGSPVTLMTGLAIYDFFLSGYFDLALNGTMVYTRGPVEENERIVTADTEGGLEVWSDALRHYSDLRVSPTGDRLVAKVINERKGLTELWISELDLARLRPLVAVAGNDCHQPVWSRDGSRIAYFCSGRDGTIRFFVIPTDGTGSPQPVPATKFTAGVECLVGFHSDDESILVILRNFVGYRELRRLPLAGAADATPRTVPVATARVQGGALAGRDYRLSPDGRCLSYTASPTGKEEIYLRCFDSTGELGVERPVAPEGGHSARWRQATVGDTLELTYYHNGFLSVRVGTGPRIEISKPVALDFPDDLRIQFTPGEIHGPASQFDFLPNGRLIFIEEQERPESDKWFHLVLDFSEELRAKVPR